MTTARAAVHVHSEWSYDGRLTLSEIAALFARHGYDAVLMCEHDRGFTAARKREYETACAEASAAGALLVPGIEYADAGDRIHVGVWGATPFLGEGVPTSRLLEAAAAHGAATVINHPRRRDAWRVIEPAWLQTCTGIEIWTRKWDGWAPNPWAVATARAQGRLGVVSLDLHRADQLFALAMELTLTEPLSVPTAVDALARGAARPLIHRVPVIRLAEGSLGRAAQRVERARRPVFRHGRRARDRLVGGH